MLLENAPDAGCWERHDGSRHPISIDPLHGLGHSVSFEHEAAQRDMQRIAMLKADYEEQWTLASSEDRETAPLRIVPRNMFYYG
jgi:hypothetical protein